MKTPNWQLKDQIFLNRPIIGYKMSRLNFKLGYNARTDRGAVELNHYAFIPLDQFKTAEPLNIMD